MTLAKQTIILYTSLFLTACATIAEIEVVDETDEYSNSKSLVTKGILRQKVDTVSAKVLFQIDPFLTMHDLMVHEKGEFKLTLSRDDALSIGITKEQYDSFLKYLNELNTKNQAITKQEAPK